MGQVIIDVPQDVHIRTTIESVEVADEILEIIERRKQANLIDDSKETNGFEKKAKETPTIIPPRRNNLKEDGDAVLGILTLDEKSADELASEIRKKNRTIT